MDVETFFNLLLAGVTLGAVYVLMAMGLTIVYGVAKVFNYAQGSFFCWGGYFAWYLIERFQWNYLISILVTIVISFFFGILFENIIVLPLRRFPNWEFTVIIVTLGCALLLDNLILVLFGPLSKTLPFLMEGVITFGNFTISIHNMLMILIAMAILVTLDLFLKKTRTGMAMRAVSQDITGAKIVGLPVNRLYSYSFGIATMLSAMSAILLIPRTLLYPLVGWTTLLKAFVVIVLGGLGNIKGTIIAAIILSIVEIFTSYLIGGIWAMPIFIIIMIVILIFKPKGLFGTW